MKLTIVTGKPGSGRTGYLFKNFKKNEDNFVVTTDASVYYIERSMSEQGFPGRCIGINSLAKTIYQEIGGISEEIISDEMQVILLTDIMKENYNSLSTLKIISYNNNTVDDISNFINSCLIYEVTPSALLDSADKMGSLSYAKIQDIAFIYDKYLEVLNKKHFINNVMLGKRIIRLLDNKSFKFKNIYIDSLNKYNPLTLGLIKALVKNSEESIVAFSVVSAKSYAFNIYRNSVNAYIDFDSFAVSLEDCTLERVSLSAKSEINNGIDIIKNELFNRDTETKATTDDVILHEASTIYKEIDFVASKIRELVSSGYSFDDVIITGTDLFLYKNIINNAFSKRGINSYYYRNKKISQTVFYDFMRNIFNILLDDFKVEYLINLVNINYFNLSDEDVTLINTFFLRFGYDLEVAFKNGEIYDNDNFIHVNLLVNNIKNIIDKFKVSLESCNSYTDYCMAVYSFFESLNLQEIFFEQYKAINGSRPQIANEIVETWNSFIGILDSINKVKGNISCNLKGFVDVFNKLCDETNLINSQEYCDEVKILDLKDAQNRKSKICFVIGCNEGKFPFNVTENLLTDVEITQLRVILDKELPLASDKMIDAYYSIYSTLTLPSDKLFISWPANDTDARPLRPASILSNVLKSFEDNFVQEKRYYDNDKEEVFFDLLTNLAEYRKTGICPEEVDDEYWKLFDDVNYAERLNNAIHNAVVNKKKINSEKVIDGYKEKDFFAVTRIERFNQCAFKHYIEYAFLPKYQKLFEENAANKGTFYHNILNNIFQYILGNKISISSLTFDRFKEIALPIINENIEKHNENVLESNVALSIEKDKMVRRILKTSWNAILQLKESDFNMFRTEFKIGKDIPLRITLDDGKVVNIIGIIDRIDEADIGSDKYVRVIDYKSGTTGFSEEKVLLGLQLQLPLYMKSIIGDYKPAGIYYSRIVDPMKDIDSSTDNISKKYQLNGLTVANMNVLEASDRLLEAGNSSNIIQVEITQKGEISKRSKVMDEALFNEFLDKAEEATKQAITRILSGETEANPLVLSNYDACDYCPYKSICHII